MRFEPYPSGRGIVSVRYEPGIDPPLRPCPFCGRADRLAVENTHTPSYWVECECGALRSPDPLGLNGSSMRAHRVAFLAAIRAWNERAPGSDEADARGTGHNGSKEG